ncbi:alanine--tRNA ligase [Ichthyobacterium seriolicida]|uniref:Alanine--tRNA ligase n=1 Tax=Ichthyobacterium seriolicida TaxID=242600 RepID=A0A1J1DWL7_9FLAO|nr:alanine--tRNA ligase [Ichthyobacterium seriolicida]BAV94250.1 alanyl-tRNA synthetase [Ichthyobacterium seriolicida]
MKSKDIRGLFLDFFKDKQHKIVESAPIISKDDPSLLFVNAGMNPFKNIFLNSEKPFAPRVSNTQKCLRVSGKHNDLEEVGRDTYHHTMFEMLGNWSFGDYFKQEAIDWAWELLTKIYKIDPKDLFVTVFEGDKKDGIELDLEAHTFWEKHLPKDRILKCGKKDNFWEMGSTGPCGPCSEIHIDIRDDHEKRAVPGRDLVNKDNPQVIEIWNLVFIQYNRKSNGVLEKLPQQHVDTGMGFERLCMILQGVKSSYDTDIFTPIISKISEITGKKYNDKEDTDIAIRVIADHLRAIAFSIADGQLPSNTGAGYVIRRILRRAVRYGFTFLERKQPFIYKIVDTLVIEMSETFTELKAKKTLIKNVIKEEEESFFKTLEQGMIRIDQMIKDSKGDTVSGEKVFQLYDTYGFPVDLTGLILKEHHMKLDEQGFKKEMEIQKNRSRESACVKIDDWIEIIKDHKGEFIGYDCLTSEVKISKYRKVTTKDKHIYQLVFNITPFYAESGGQIGDTGYIESSNVRIPIIDTKKENNLTVHIVNEIPENTTDTFNAAVEKSRRNKITINHSATHLLHQALRNILGQHVEQKGSYVSDKYLRFDFSHFSKLSPDQIRDVEKFVNNKVRSNIILEEKREVPIDEAKAQGATALFGEKYSDLVRVIKFGDSIELCGGTHVKQTGDIFLFKITQETSIATGIRRVEAITSSAAEEFFTEKLNLLEEVKSKLKNTSDPIKAITDLQEENSIYKKKILSMTKEKTKSIKANLLKSISRMEDINFISTELDLDTESVKSLAFELDREIQNLFFIAGSVSNGKINITVFISKNLVKERNLSANEIIQKISREIDGRGGGQDFFAIAGGKNQGGLPRAMQLAKEYIS